MIREILTYLSERPTLAEAKSFGHLVESISLLSREKRCQKAWNPHRFQCKNFITTHIKNALHYDSILVLGSGPLHEIPIETLAQKFKRVVLVDVVHLTVTKKAYKHLSNIEFIEHEITEIESIVMLEKQLIDKIPTAFLKENWGLVLSVNIMSQLPIHFSTYIHKNLKNKFSDVQVENFLNNLTSNHLRYLESFSCNVLLITDTETYYCDKKDTIIETDKNYTHLSLPSPIETWTWNLAPIPEFQKDVALKMKVSGFVLKNINSH